MSNQNKYALVTGASSGIGSEFARVLAEKQYNLLLAARRIDRLKSLAEELKRKHGIEVLTLSIDLAQPDASQEVYRFTQENSLRIEVLVNNAGFGMYGNFLESKQEETTRMLHLNMLTLTNLTYLFGKDMAKMGNGYILQVSSVGAFQPSPLYAAYSATKSYVMLFSEALDAELKSKSKNVSVTTLYPGATKSEFHAVANHNAGSLIQSTKMSARAVAEAGVKAMCARKRSVTPGLVNQFNELAIKFLPRRLGTAIAGWVVR